MAAVGVDGDAETRRELAVMRVGDDVSEHAAPLVHLPSSACVILLSCMHGSCKLKVWQIIDLASAETFFKFNSFITARGKIYIRTVESCTNAVTVPAGN